MSAELAIFCERLKAALECDAPLTLSELEARFGGPLAAVAIRRRSTFEVVDVVLSGLSVPADILLMKRDPEHRCPTLHLFFSKGNELDGDEMEWALRESFGEVKFEYSDTRRERHVSYHAPLSYEGCGASGRSMYVLFKKKFGKKIEIKPAFIVNTILFEE